VLKYRLLSLLFILYPKKSCENMNKIKHIVNKNQIVYVNKNGNIIFDILTFPNNTWNENSSFLKYKRCLHIGLFYNNRKIITNIK